MTLNGMLWKTCMLFFIILNSFVSCDTININGNLITVPTDFNIEVYSDNTLSQPRVLDSIIYDDNLIVYAGNKDSNNNIPIYALVDSNMDGTNDHTLSIFNVPNGESAELNGVCIDPITNYIYFMTQEKMYICFNAHDYALSQISGYTGDYTQNDANCTLFMTFPINSVDATHARHYAEFSPSGDDLCIAFGADCDNCDSCTEPRCTIRCYNMTHIRAIYSYNQLISNNGINYDDGDSRVVAYGVRNSVGFDWHPITNNLYFTDNGANDIYPTQNPKWDTFSPDDELNVILNEGDHFGYPYIHSNGSGNPYLRNAGMVTGIEDETYYTPSDYQLAIQVSIN